MLKGPVVCPFCGCGCSFYLDQRGGDLRGVVPSTSHPVSRGTLCIKGWRAFEFLGHPDRLKAPMVKKYGIIREATWDEALDSVASRLLQIQKQHGQDAIGFLSSAKMSNEENYLFMKLARAVFKTNNIDHCARL